jgi:uncharacterized protein
VGGFDCVEASQLNGSASEQVSEQASTFELALCDKATASDAKLALAALIAGTTSPPQHEISPGFDCSRASSKAEIAICANSELADRDRTLNELYKKLIGSSSKRDKPSIVKAQQDWVSRRDNCTDAELEACIQSLYDGRIVELRKRSSN